MSKARQWHVVYMGRYDTALSHSGCMPYHKARTEAARHKREGARLVEIVESDRLYQRRNEWAWHNAFLGGQPPLV